MRSTTTTAAVLFAALSASAALASPVTLQNPVGTFSQGGLDVAHTIDGVTTGLNGWAIDPEEGHNQTAVYQTQSNVGGPGGTRFTFSLFNEYPDQPGHVLGDFRISVTTDSRSTFATNGLQTGGDVAANWTQLVPTAAVATNGITLAIQPDNSILASGTPTTSDFTVTATTSLAGITGIRLEALTNPSLPHNGPGMQSANGNFVLDEFQVNAVQLPEPSTFLLFALGGAGLIAYRMRSRHR